MQLTYCPRCRVVYYGLDVNKDCCTWCHRNDGMKKRLETLQSEIKQWGTETHFTIKFKEDKHG